MGRLKGKLESKKEAVSNVARCKMSGQVKREGEKKKVALFPGSWGQAVRLDSFLFSREHT